MGKREVGNQRLDGYWDMEWWSPWVDLRAHIITHRFERHRSLILRLLHV